MSAHPDDDLFKDSTMSFGEHLEELRGALFRSLIGIMIGFILGLMLAKHAVHLIETPLQNGLRKHYLAVARDKLKSGAYGDAGLDQWRMLTEQQLVPRRLTIDADSLLRELHHALPTAFPAPSSDEAAFDDQSLSRDNAIRLVRAWHRSAMSATESFAKTLWQSLSSADQELFTRLATSDSDDNFARPQTDVLRCLNLLSIELDPLSAADHLEALFGDPSRRAFFSGELARMARNDSAARLARVPLNRQLIAAAFPGTIQLPPPSTMELTTWQPIDVDVQALSVHEPFMVFVKAALVLGLVLSSPWVFYQIWLFVAAGLYPQEKHLVYRFMPISLGLFLLGAALAFFFVFQPVLDFLFGFNRMLNINAQPRITDWLSFVLILPLGFGISFQLPLVMVLLERVGVFTIQNYRDYWRVAVLVIFVLSMLLTPADPVSMLMMAMPLTGLYFGGIALCRQLHSSNRSPVGAGYDP